MVMLTEVKADTRHYFIDAKNRIQGEYKTWWYANGQLLEHCFYIDDEYHGERKYWDPDGTLVSHKFWVNDDIYRDLLVNPVDNKDKFLIALETGAKWLC